jgi:hypothetical protein
VRVLIAWVAIASVPRGVGADGPASPERRTLP